MKIKLADFREVLDKVGNIVGDRSVVQDLRAFNIKPCGEVLKVVGTDSNLLLISEIPYEESENSDGSVLTISDNRIRDIVRYSTGEDIELVYSVDRDDIDVVADGSISKIAKHHVNLEEILNFDLGEGEDFSKDDELDKGSLKYLLERLIAVVNDSVTDTSQKTIFFTGDRAVVQDDSILVVADFVTEKGYELSTKVGRQLLSLMNRVEDDEPILFKDNESDGTIVVKVGEDILSFGRLDVYEPQLELLDTFKAATVVEVDRANFLRELNLIQSTSEENIGYFKIGQEGINLYSIDGGEKTEVDVFALSDIKTKELLEIEFIIPILIDLLKIMSGVRVEISIDKEEGVLKLRQEEGKMEAMTTINLV